MVIYVSYYGTLGSSSCSNIFSFRVPGNVLCQPAPRLFRKRIQTIHVNGIPLHNHEKHVNELCSFFDAPSAGLTPCCGFRNVCFPIYLSSDTIFSFALERFQYTRGAFAEERDVEALYAAV